MIAHAGSNKVVILGCDRMMGIDASSIIFCHITDSVGSNLVMVIDGTITDSNIQTTKDQERG